MKLKYLLFLLFNVFGTLQLFAQDPAKYVLGEKQLSNTDIYSILYSQNNQLIIGTNQGVFVYGYNSFTPLKKDPKIKGNSFFSLAENSKGEVFCNTIYGSVCKIAGDSLILFYQVDKKHLTPSVSIGFNQEDDLIFSSKSILKITNEKNIEVIETNNIYGSLLFFGLNHEIYGSTLDKDSMFDLSGQRLAKVKINIPDRNKPSSSNLTYSRFLKLDEKVICTIDKEFGVSAGLVSSIGREKQEDYYPSVDGKHLWGRRAKEGIRKIYFKGNKLVADAPIFNNTFISFVHHAKDGTLFLGTFGQGVWVIPSLKTFQYSLNNNQEILHKIIAIKDGVFAITNKKNCVNLSHEGLNYLDKSAPVKFLNPSYPHQPLSTQNGKFIEFYFEYFLTEYRLPTIKAFWQQDSNYFFATTKGINTFGDFTNDNKHWILPKNQSHSNLYRNFKRYDKLKQRINSICFANNNIYAGTEAALFKIDKGGDMIELLYDGKPIISNHLNSKDGIIYCATENLGILRIEGDKVSALKNVPNLPYLKTTPWQDQLIFQSKEGNLYLYNLEKNTMRFLGINEGVYGYVNDYDVFGDKVSYIFDSKNIGQTKIDALRTNTFKFNIAIDSFIVNDHLTDAAQLKDLNYKQNQLRIYAKASELNLRQNKELHYKLKGLDNKWNVLPKGLNEIVFKSLVPGEYTLLLKGMYGNESSNVIAVPIAISAPFWKTNWFYLLLILFISGLALLIFTIRIRRIKRLAKEKLEKQKLMTDLVDSQLTALRSQMNPHFIFNSLNSIQDLILQEKTDASYDYIVLFADLVRDTLNYSKMGFIPIEKEINFLETYLKLEKLRFGDLFEYKITSNATEEIEVPSLIIQPFIENALLHGLLHKKGLRKLEIGFDYKDKLICIVKDNGIGRKKSEEIKERQGGAHQSFALQAIEKRLSILETQYGFDIGFTIRDLYEDQKAAGTEVVITMPYKTRF